MPGPPTFGVILVSGIPGAGKSTVARSLAEHIPRAVHIEGDVLQRMIRSGGEWPGREISPEADRQLRLRARNACILADSFSAAGFTPIVDDVLAAFRLDDYLTLLQSRPVHYLLLLPDLETVRTRNAMREGKDVFEAWSFLDEEVRALQPRGLILDTSAVNEDETVGLVLKRLSNEGRVA